MLGAISTIIVGIFGVMKKGKRRWAWFRFAMSIFGTAFVSFWGTWGVIGGGALTAGAEPIVALATGFFAGALTMATAVLALWLRSPLTKGIPILAPMKVEENLLDEDGFVYTEK